MAHSAPFTQSDHRTTTRFSRGAEEIEYRFKEHCQIHSLPPISTEEKKEKTRLTQQRRNKENRAIRALAGKLVNDHEKIKFLQENTNNQIFEKIKIKSAPDQSKTFPPPPIKKRRDQKEPQEKEKPTEQGQRKIKEFLNKETNEQKQRFSSPKYPQETGPERTLGSETAPLQTQSDSQIQESHELQEGGSEKYWCACPFSGRGRETVQGVDRAAGRAQFPHAGNGKDSLVSRSRSV